MIRKGTAKPVMTMLSSCVRWNLWQTPHVGCERGQNSLKGFELVCLDLKDTQFKILPFTETGVKYWDWNQPIPLMG